LRYVATPVLKGNLRVTLRFHALRLGHAGQENEEVGAWRQFGEAEGSHARHKTACLSGIGLELLNPVDMSKALPMTGDRHWRTAASSVLKT